MPEPNPNPVIPPGPITRRRLHELVWSVPRLRLAAAFGISDVALGKLCRHRFVPAPPNGYWAKVKVGTAPPREEIPDGLDPDEVVYTIKERLPPAPLSEPTPQRDPDVTAAIVALEAIGRIAIAPDLSAPHPVVTAALQWLDPRAAKKRARIPWNSNEPLELCPLVLDVSDATRERALRVLDALLQTFTRLGFETIIREEDQDTRHRPSWQRAPTEENRASTDVLGSRMWFLVREREHQVPADGVNRIHGPGARTGMALERSGRLYIELHGPHVNWRSESAAMVHRWSDGKKKRLEGQLAEIVQAAILRAQQVRIDRAERRAREERERLENEAQAREKKLREDEQKRFDRLIKMVERWEWSERLAEFAAECRRRVNAETSAFEARAAAARMSADANAAPVTPTVNPDVLRWIEWIERLATGNNPFGRGLEAARRENAGIA